MTPDEIQELQKEASFWEEEWRKAGLECFDLAERLSKAEAACKRLRIERDNLMLQRQEATLILNRGRSYHGSEKHNKDWHDGFDTAVRLWLGEDWQ